MEREIGMAMEVVEVGTNDSWLKKREKFVEDLKFKIR